MTAPGHSCRIGTLALFFQAADDELRAISRQDSSFGGLLLAIVDSFFFVCPLCSKFPILWRNNRWLTTGIAVQAMDDELRAIARENFLFGGLLVTVFYLCSFRFAIIS